VINEKILCLALNMWKNPLYQIMNSEYVDFIEKTIYKCNLKPPRKPYPLFVGENFNNVKGKTELKEVNSALGEKWRSLTKKEKEPYRIKSKKEFDEYRKDLYVINFVLFFGYDGVEKKQMTDYRYFKATKIIECKNKGELKRPKFYTNELRKQWQNIDYDTKNACVDGARDFKSWVNKSLKLKKESAQILFMDEQIEKIGNSANINICDMAKEWDNLSEEKKKEYHGKFFKYYMENELLLNVFDLNQYDVKKKSPSAFKLFKKDLETLYDQKNQLSIMSIYSLWNKLERGTRDLYRKKSKRLKLAYKYRKIVIQKRLTNLGNLTFYKVTGFNIYIKSGDGKKLLDEGVSKNTLKYLYNTKEYIQKEYEEKVEKKEINNEGKKIIKKNGILHPLKTPPSEFEIFYNKNKEKIMNNITYKSTNNFMKSASILFKKLKDNNNINEYIKKRFEYKKDYDKRNYYLEPLEFLTLEPEGKKILPKKFKKRNEDNKIYFYSRPGNVSQENKITFNNKDYLLGKKKKRSENNSNKNIPNEPYRKFAPGTRFVTKENKVPSLINNKKEKKPKKKNTKK
jgi:hypothetical protein